MKKMCHCLLTGEILKEDAKSSYVEDALICICQLFDTVSNGEKTIIKTCER